MKVITFKLDNDIKDSDKMGHPEWLEKVSKVSMGMLKDPKVQSVLKRDLVVGEDFILKFQFGGTHNELYITGTAKKDGFVLDVNLLDKPISIQQLN